MSEDKFLWKLDKEQCISCGICADLCPQKAIIMTKEMAFPEYKSELCDFCFTCEKECPSQAICFKHISA